MKKFINKKNVVIAVIVAILIAVSAYMLSNKKSDVKTNTEKTSEVTTKEDNKNTVKSDTKKEDKKDNKQEVKEDKKSDTKVEETKTTEVTDTNTSTNVSNNTSSTTVENTNTNTVSNTQPVSTPCVPTYTTVNHPEQGHYETQVVQEAYDQPVYAERMVGGQTGRIYNSSSEFMNQDEDYSYSLKQIQVDTIHHDAVTQQVWVVDQQAWTETVSSGC